MFKRMKTLHLLILITSVLSILLIQQVVFAQWQPPTNSPSETIVDNTIMFNPLVEDIDLNGKFFIDSTTGMGSLTPINKKGILHVKIDNNTKTGLYVENIHPSGNAATFLGNIRIVGDINATGKITSGATKRGYWTSSGNNIYYNDGNIGLGIDIPGYKLHITDDDSTAVFNIDNEGTDLWTGTRLARDGSEKWFIGMNDTKDNLLFRYADFKDAVSISSSNGDMGVNSNLTIGDNVNGNQYLEIDNTSTAPDSGDCTTDSKGRMILVGDDELYICSSSSGVAAWYISNLTTAHKK